MATNVCPACKSTSFTWSIHEEDIPLTKWSCHKCGYTALEDESSARECPHCHNKTEIKLVDTEKTYWWCSSCSRVTILRDE